MLSGGPNSVFADGAPGIDSVKKLKNKKNSFIFSPLARFSEIWYNTRHFFT